MRSAERRRAESCEHVVHVEPGADGRPVQVMSGATIEEQRVDALASGNYDEAGKVLTMTSEGWCAISFSTRYVISLEVNLSRRKGSEEQIKTNPKQP